MKLPSGAGLVLFALSSCGGDSPKEVVLDASSAPPDVADDGDAAKPCELTKCGDKCVDLSVNPMHCGSCTTDCSGGLSAAGGACVLGKCEPITPFVSLGSATRVAAITADTTQVFVFANGSLAKLLHYDRTTKLTTELSPLKFTGEAFYDMRAVAGAFGGIRANRTYVWGDRHGPDGTGTTALAGEVTKSGGRSSSELSFGPAAPYAYSEVGSNWVALMRAGGTGGDNFYNVVCSVAGGFGAQSFPRRLFQDVASVAIEGTTAYWLEYSLFRPEEKRPDALFTLYSGDCTTPGAVPKQVWRAENANIRGGNLLSLPDGMFFLGGDVSSTTRHIYFLGKGATTPTSVYTRSRDTLPNGQLKLYDDGRHVYLRVGPAEGEGLHNAYAEFLKFDHDGTLLARFGVRSGCFVEHIAFVDGYAFGGSDHDSCREAYVLKVP